MNATRRGFFRSLARAAAIVALAPQIAFRVPAPRTWTAEEKWTAVIDEEPVRLLAFWTQDARHTHCYSEEYLAALQISFNQPNQTNP